jgi:hypothetical protein
MWVGDPGSEIFFYIPDPKTGGQKGTGSRIRIRSLPGKLLIIYELKASWFSLDNIMHHAGIWSYWDLEI